MDIDESRDFLLKFMYKNFTDKTFYVYITEGLPTDFACEMANAIAAELEGQNTKITKAKIRISTASEVRLVEVRL